MKKILLLILILELFLISGCSTQTATQQNNETQIKENNNPTLKELRDNFEYYLNKEITIEGLAEPNIWCPSVVACMLGTDYLTSEDKITVPSSKVVIPIATPVKYGLTLLKYWKCSGSLNKLEDEQYYYFNATYCECLTC